MTPLEAAMQHPDCHVVLGNGHSLVIRRGHTLWFCLNCYRTFDSISPSMRWCR